MIQPSWQPCHKAVKEGGGGRRTEGGRLVVQKVKVLGLVGGTALEARRRLPAVLPSPLALPRSSLLLRERQTMRNFGKTRSFGSEKGEGVLSRVPAFSAQMLKLLHLFFLINLLRAMKAIVKVQARNANSVFLIS